MRIPYKWQKCILCCQNPPDSCEHLFPQSIGGNLELMVLCEGCNKNRSAKLYAGIKYDWWLVQAARRCESTIPKLVHYILEGQPGYLRTSGGSWVPYEVKNGKPEAKVIEKGGTKVGDDAKIRSILSGKAKKTGNPNVVLERVQELLNKAQDDTPVLLPMGYKYTRHRITQDAGSFEKGCFCDSAAVLMAYEYLAIQYGEDIFSPMWQPIRDILLAANPDLAIRDSNKSPYCIVSSFKSESPQPSYVIWLEEEKRGFSVEMEFFGTFGKRVYFPQFPLPAYEVVILQDLQPAADRNVFFAESLAHARRNEWF